MTPRDMQQLAGYFSVQQKNLVVSSGATATLILPNPHRFAFGLCNSAVANHAATISPQGTTPINGGFGYNSTSLLWIDFWTYAVLPQLGWSIFSINTDSYYIVELIFNDS